MDEKQFNIVDELNALAAEAHTEEASADNAKAPNDTPDLSMDDQLNTLRATNWDLLNYFRSVYVTQSEQIQTLKTELFELNVKIEELEKTKNIYNDDLRFYIMDWKNSIDIDEYEDIEMAKIMYNFIKK